MHPLLSGVPWTFKGIIQCSGGNTAQSFVSRFLLNKSILGRDPVTGVRTMPSKTVEKVDGDVERGLSDSYLYNDTIHTLYFDKVSVRVRDKRSPKGKQVLLHSLDGAASAGRSNSRPVLGIPGLTTQATSLPSWVHRAQERPPS